MEGKSANEDVKKLESWKCWKKSKMQQLLWVTAK